MTTSIQAEQKAKDIYLTMLNAGNGFTTGFFAQQCALILVNEMIEVVGNADKVINGLIDVLQQDDKKYFTKSNGVFFWHQVREALTNQKLNP